MTADYLLYFFNIPDLSPLGLLALFLLSLMRIAPIIALAPFLGGKVTPVTTRIGMAIIFTIVFLPVIVATSGHQDLGFDFNFSFLAIKELFLGLIMGFLASIPFTIVQSSGIIVDFARGASMMQAQDPTMQNQSSSIGNLFNYMLIALFFELDGPFLFFDAVIKSYELIPASALINPLFFNLKAPLWDTLCKLLHQIMAISVQLAAPAIIAVLMTEVFLGIANRLAPQVQISFLGMSLKSLAALLLLWVGWFFIFKHSSQEALTWFDKLEQIVMSFQHFKSSG
jgi:type III secretion protein T